MTAIVVMQTQATVALPLKRRHLSAVHRTSPNRRLVKRWTETHTDGDVISVIDAVLKDTSANARR
jgi:hypothetical protein